LLPGDGWFTSAPKIIKGPLYKSCKYFLKSLKIKINSDNCFLLEVKGISYWLSFDNLKFFPPSLALIFKQILEVSLSNDPRCFLIEFSSIA